MGFGPAVLGCPGLRINQLLPGQFGIVGSGPAGGKQIF